MIPLYRDDLFIFDPWPAVYIRCLDAIVLADLHLGIEGALVEEGVFLPRNISRATVDMVFDIVDESGAGVVILDGDIKHGFGLLNTSEWIFVKQLFSGLVDRGVEVVVIRGNHDNYLGVVLSRYGIDFLERYDVGIYSIVHGHVKYPWDSLNEVVIIGHEHPSVNLRDEVGIKFKFKVFLWGSYRGHRIMVLPPIGELASGSDISMYMYDETLSPLLRGVDLGGFKPYAIVPSKVIQELPHLRDLEHT